MELPTFNRDTLRKRLIRLDHMLQLVFGAACCERLLPNYLAFQNETGWGNFSAVRKGLDYIWEFLNGYTPNSYEIVNITDACESAAPNSEDYQSLYVTSAQDACFAVCGLLDFLSERNVDSIVQAATYATDSVDLYVQEIENMAPNDPELERKILMHHLMQRELAEQEKILKIIEQAHSLTSEVLTLVKSSWNNNGKSNLDLPQ